MNTEIYGKYAPYVPDDKDSQEHKDKLRKLVISLEQGTFNNSKREKDDFGR